MPRDFLFFFFVIDFGGSARSDRSGVGGKYDECEIEGEEGGWMDRV